MRKIALMALAGATMFTGVAGAATVNAATLQGTPDTQRVPYMNTTYIVPLMNDSLASGDAWNNTFLKDSKGNLVKTLTTKAGTFTVDADKFMVKYVAAKGFWGSTTVGYAGTSVKGNKVESAMTFNVDEPSAAKAVADRATVKAGSSVTLNVLKNDVDTGADILKNTLALKGDANATWTDQKNGGDIVVTPKKGFVGTLNGSYTVKDDAGRTLTAPITIKVTGDVGATTTANKPTTSTTAKPSTKPAPAKVVVKPTTSNHVATATVKPTKATAKPVAVVSNHGKVVGPMVQTDYVPAKKAVNNKFLAR